MSLQAYTHIFTVAGQQN